MTSSSTQLTAASPAFDRRALEALYVKLERKIYNVVYRWLWNPDDAADVTQEAFVKLWSMRARVRPDTVEALAYRIAVNTAANRRRARRLWNVVTLDSLTSPAHDHEATDLERRVRAAVDALPERLRRVVVLAEFSGMTAKEIGAGLDLQEGTVASRRHHALAQLKTALGPLMGTDTEHGDE